MGKGMSKVVDNLYVGSFADSNDKEGMDRYGITHIVTAMERGRRNFDDKSYLIIEVSDTYGENISQHFTKAIEFIHEQRLAGNGVLVHCMAGASRSVTLVVAYLATITQIPWRDCLNGVRAARKQANPNLGFQQQLDLFERQSVNEARSLLFERFPVYPFAEDDKNMLLGLIDAFALETAQPQSKKIGGFYDNLPSLNTRHLGISPEENAACESDAIQDVTVSPGGTAVGFTIPGNRSGKRYPPAFNKSSDTECNKSNESSTPVNNNNEILPEGETP